MPAATVAPDSADYVVVGAGPAGCVLANRLSAAPGNRVVLLEAGGPDKAREIRIPAAFSKLFTTAYDWNFRTAPQPALAGRELFWPRGRVLGGSTSINAQMWIRGCAADYDGWGVPGWSYDEVLPHFERITHPGGPLHIEELRSPSPITAAFLAACAEAGIRATPDLNGPDNSGCSPTPVTQRRGARHSAADAYLRPAMRRANLTVVTGATVDRLRLSGPGKVKRVTGVSYRAADGTVRELTAQREVLLCAGAVGSPHILQLSGIGDPDRLRAAGIDPLIELPGVGANLQDHLSAGVVLTCPEPITMVAAESLGNVARYLLTRKGMLSSNVAEAVAFLSRNGGPPDIELIFAPVPFIEHGQVDPPGHGLTIGAVLLQPTSRGTVTPASANPAEPPIIEPAYLSTPGDLEMLMWGLRQAERLAATTAMKPYAGPPMPPYTGPADDTTLATSIREHSETLYHPVGTCRMGTGEDAVVDPDLNVHGVTGLRVVDASVMPTINRGHTMAPVYMIAEKAATLITN
ncbi:GMC family oxidoreductase N-terminal domain-containing protein [Dactylosporangium vinaceum]|uniref:GMC family oxidoreductase n=1 Tax=Dactylosporangium vinaceum TaxID=53362 RepID=A0ABV5MBB0_9ACTN|nr:GMC family oxidoreductase N-terminal domain-containing protein [Dactylosporangium vinaceum]UAB98369.1 GMC family oxidoreductase N-terminal domain-containing protein [Dactylosporangium vinaceum]